MRYWVIDANVMLLAGTMIAEVTEEELLCWEKSRQFIHDICKNKDVIVVDDGWEIIREYRNMKTIRNYPNSTDDFYHYIMENQQEHVCFVHLEKTGEYDFSVYPESVKLQSFDPPDRKYIAVSYNHENHPPIVEAADSKWWGIRKDLHDAGIELMFIDEDYIRALYQKKMGVME